jgi:hypothetical protein
VGRVVIGAVTVVVVGFVVAGAAEVVIKGVVAAVEGLGEAEVAMTGVVDVVEGVALIVVGTMVSTVVAVGAVGAERVVGDVAVGVVEVSSPEVVDKVA